MSVAPSTKEEKSHMMVRVFTGRRLKHSVCEAVLSFNGLRCELLQGVDTELDRVECYDMTRPRSVAFSPCFNGGPV